MLWTIIGLSAAALSMFSFVPQIVKAIKTKSTKDVSIVTLFQLSLAVALWIAYGVHLRDAIIIFANSVTLASLVILLCLYFNYSKAGERR